MTSHLLRAAVIAVVTLSPAAASAEMPPASRWTFGPIIRGKTSSPGMPLHPRQGAGDAVVFDLPQDGRAELDAMTTPVSSLDGARSITLRYRIDAAPGTRFRATDLVNEAPTVSIYFQRAGDTWTGRGRYASYRWYVPARAVMPLSPGEHSVTIRFDEVWTNVYGKLNTDHADEYRAALAEADNVGLAFGSRSRRSHGIVASGPARFTLLDLEIR